jgi:hypothetical protein
MDEKPIMSFLNTSGYDRLRNNIAIQGVTQSILSHYLIYWEMSPFYIVVDFSGSNNCNYIPDITDNTLTWYRYVSA